MKDMYPIPTTLQLIKKLQKQKERPEKKLDLLKFQKNPKQLSASPV
jgi:hypothetical protein